ncbi:MAG: ATP-binding cassette domain-containing protein, partial [Alistipes sp.]|nr:ATP-binding cassette domain-containing protein [Alistipes sp.]
PVYMVPQHFGQWDATTVAAVLGIDKKIRALHSILAGSVLPGDFELLAEDWDIEQRARKELEKCGVGHLSPETPFSRISGGEKTRVFLAGALIHDPVVILMDEPTNHLDRQGRDFLHRSVENSRATILVVSHDRELLDMAEVTLELSPKGVKRFGGNYSFYRDIHDEHLVALQAGIEYFEKSVRQTEMSAQRSARRKEKSDVRAEKREKKACLPRIVMGNMKDGAQKSAAKIKDTATGKLEKEKENLEELRRELHEGQSMRITLGGPKLHKGKVLVKAEGIDFGYDPQKTLWREPLDVTVHSGDRIRIEGGNGSGKTTLVWLLTGSLAPSRGKVYQAQFGSLFIDQQYSFIDNCLTVTSQVEKYNARRLPDHMIRTELNRLLFPRRHGTKNAAYSAAGKKCV